MNDKLKLADWITEVAGEYIDSWVADVIAESWQEDKNRIRELEEALSFVCSYFDEPAYKVDRGYTKQVRRYIDSLLETPR